MVCKTACPCTWNTFLIIDNKVACPPHWPTEDIAKRVVGAIEADTGAAMAAIREILTTIDHINQAQQSIAAAVEEKSATTGDISRNVSESAASSTTNASTISAVAAGAEQATSAARSTSDSAKQLIDLAANLRQALAGLRT